MQESRSKNSLKNVFWSYFNILVGLLTGFVSRSIFIKTIGIEYLGINGLFSNVLSLLSLADLGFGTAMAYSYYKPIADNDIEQIAGLNLFYKNVYRYIAIAIAIIGMLIVPFLDKMINVQKDIEHLHVYYLLALAGVVSSYLMVYKGTLISAYQKNYVVSRYNSIIKIITTASQILLMILTKSYIIYLIVVLLGNIINNLRISIAADKMFPFIKTKKTLKIDKKRELFNNIKSVFLYKISGVLINGTDNILISTLVGTVWVGVYSNYLIIINNITSLVNMFFTSFTASIGNLMVMESEEKRLEIFKILQLISQWFSLVIVPCVYVLINLFVELWLGKEFILDEYTVMAIILNLYLTCVLQPIWIYREATGMYLKTKYIMLVTAILNVFFSIWWGTIYGISGILFASAISKVLTYIWYEPILLFKNFLGKKVTKFFLELLYTTLMMVIICSVLECIMQFIKTNGWFGFFVKGCILFAITNILFLVLFCKRKSFKIIIIKIKNIRRKSDVQK